MKLKCLVAVLACLPAGLGWGLSESEPNGARSIANGPFTFPETITGNFQQDGEFLHDYFSFSATSGISYSFVAQVTNANSFDPLDPDLAIENSSGVEVGSATAAGGNQTETLNWTAPSSGTYYLIAHEGTNTPNGLAGYSISAQQTSNVNDWDLY